VPPSAVRQALWKPVGLSAVCGDGSTKRVPFEGQLAEKATFKARLEPALREFRLSRDKGKMETGAKEFPFTITFAPKASEAKSTTLVVVFNDDETKAYRVRINGRIAGCSAGPI
jgi:hypothetical protein